MRESTSRGRTVVPVTCEVCQVVFHAPPSQHRRFCSHACQGALLAKQAKARGWEPRFWAYVEKRGLDECWPWMGARNTDGYGILGIDRSAESAHRLSWRVHYGEIPPEGCVLHRCDNPPCVNPRHLFLGDRTINNADKMAKGRQRNVGQPGVANGAAVLTEEAVLQIRTRYAAGHIRHIDLARDFGISNQSVSYIVRGVSWTHVGGPLAQGRFGARAKS